MDSFEKIKEQKQEQKLETERNETLKDLKEFLIEKLDFLPFSILNQKSSKELLNLYKHYLEQKANLNNFKKFYKEAAQKEINEKKPDEYFDKYKTYLLGKLPQQLQERLLEISEKQQETEKEFIKRLEEIHREREKINQRMILGFHCSDINFWKGEKETFIKSGSKEEVIGDIKKTGLHFYSIDPQHLYVTRSKFLYLVEGSMYEIKNNKNVQSPYWFYTERDLPVLKVIPLDNEVVESLDLKFEK